MKRQSATLVLASLLGLSVSSGQTISTFFVGGHSGMAIDAQGTVYLTEPSTATVYKLSGGVLTRIAGNGKFGYAGDGGPATSATLFMSSGTSGVAVDSSGNVYFTDGYNNVIRKINQTTGVITTYAGNGTGAGTGFGGFAGDNGPATNAQLDIPTDIALDANGNLYICDTSNSRVRKVTPGGVITTFAGNGNVVTSGDGGQAAAAAVPSPAGITVDAQGNVYIASDRRVRKVDAATGIITTYAGNGVRAFAGDGGLATAASIRGAVGLGVDQFGNLYLADTSNATNSTRVRKVDAAGIITSYAGIDGNSSTPLGDGGPAINAYIGAIGDLMVDSVGAVYVGAGSRIRKITPAGAGLLVNPASLSFSAATSGAAPASQTLNITSSGAALGYTAAASSTGNWLSIRPGSGTTPGTVTVSVNPGGLGSGTYTGTITFTPTVSGNSAAAVTVTLTISGAGAPFISSAGSTAAIYNASSYGTNLAPGVEFVLFGGNLGPASIQIASTPAYPTNLAGTSITFTPLAGGADIQAKMVYTLAGQVAALLPSSTSPGTYAVRVTYNGLTSAARNVTVLPRAFGIATSNSAGSGLAQATIGNVNGGISLTRFTAGTVAFNGYDWTLTPARPGDTLVFWGTGGGADLANDSGGSSGNQAQAGNFKILVAGREIIPLYAGTSSGYPGLWQINFTLPADIAPDCFTTAQVSAGGEVSNTVVIPIAAAGQNACSNASMPTSLLSKLDSGANINFGAFVLARTTETLSATTQESATGSILSFTATEWTTLNSGPVFGACRLYDRTYPQGGKDPGSPSLTLNAGTRLPLSGQNLPAGLGMNITPTILGPFYGASLSAGTFANSNYSLSAPGGNDVGPFSSTTIFPASFTATNFSSITSVNRNQPLTFTWTGTGIDQVGIIITSSLTSGGVSHITTLNCTNIPSGPGTYTIPAAALAGLLTAGVTGANFGAVSITGINSQGKFGANLTKGGQLDIGTFWSEIGVAKNIAVQ